MTPNPASPFNDLDALRAMARATACPPLPIEPQEERALVSSLLAADIRAATKPALAPAPAAPKPAYEPLPTETDTRKIKPGTTR